MNSYDFDKTVFYPDSSFSFTLYCAAHHPFAVAAALPGMVYMGIRHLLKLSDTKALKQRAFYFLRFLKDVDADVQRFWEKKGGNIRKWYLARRRDDDIIISASPEFLLRPMTDRLNVRLIGTRMDKHTGEISGNNCHDKEKVVRLFEQYPGAVIEEFYSDSLSDTPMARLAERAFIVDKDTLSPWPDK